MLLRGLCLSILESWTVPWCLPIGVAGVSLTCRSCAVLLGFDLGEEWLHLGAVPQAGVEPFCRSGYSFDRRRFAERLICDLMKGPWCPPVITIRYVVCQGLSSLAPVISPTGSAGRMPGSFGDEHLSSDSSKSDQHTNPVPAPRNDGEKHCDAVLRAEASCHRTNRLLCYHHHDLIPVMWC
jgi:hypothetical protein